MRSPSLREAVDDAIDQEGGIELANEFAENLAQKGQAWHETDWIKYKALLSVAGHPYLQDAIQLMHGLDAYELRPDVAATWDYAELVLAGEVSGSAGGTVPDRQAARVGQRMMEENHASITDYGLLRRKDSGQLPVFRKEQKEAPPLGRNGDGIMESKSMERQWLLDRLETLSVKEQNQMAAAIISRGSAEGAV